MQLLAQLHIKVGRLLEKLSEKPSNWKKNLIMTIYRDFLQDDEAYLIERLNNLHNGDDYWQLVNYYKENGQHKKALETARTGFLKFKEGTNSLFEYLFDYYAKRLDENNLLEIVNIALEQNSERTSKVKEILDKMFDYSRQQNDYDKAKEYLLKAYNVINGERYYSRGYYQEYKLMKEFLLPGDWDEIEPKVVNDAREKSVNDYLMICLEKGVKEEVVEIITSPRKNSLGYLIHNNFDNFAAKLEQDFPEKIIEYYWQRAYGNIPGGNRKTYQVAFSYLTKVKNIYVKQLKAKNTWEQRFNRLKVEFSNRPAFLDEVKSLK